MKTNILDKKLNCTRIPIITSEKHFYMIISILEDFYINENKQNTFYKKLMFILNNRDDRNKVSHTKLQLFITEYKDKIFSKFELSICEEQLIIQKKWCKNNFIYK